MPVRDEASGEELLTPEEAASELGLSRATLRVQTFRGRLRVKKLSERVVLYPRSAIEEYKRENHQGLNVMHLFRVKHGPGNDLDALHEQLVAEVAAGKIPLQEREATPEEAREAWGDLLILRRMLTARAMDDGDALYLCSIGLSYAAKRA
jgi:hypothetical protein